MKKIYSLALPIFVGFLFIIIPVRAQECFEVIKTPLGSTVNTWDWRGTLYDFYLKLAPPSNNSYLQLSEVSPFHSLNYSIQPNTFHLAFHPNESNDYEPSEGWELLYKNFGTLQVPVFNPSFALYNRYDGKVRIFIWANTTNVFQNAIITVNQRSAQFNKKSSVLEHAITPMNALDKFSKGVKINTSNVYTTQNGTWLFFEFGAAFDPCTCLHSTAIEITPQLLGNISIDLKLTGTGVTNQIITPSSTMTASDNGFLSSWGDIVGSFKQGYKGYNDINKYASGIEKFINAIGMIGAPTPTPGVPGTPTPPTKPPFRFPSFLKNAPGYIGFAAGIIEYFSAKGQPDPNAVKPLTFHSAYSFSGTGEASYSAVNGPALLYTPGSIQNIVGLPAANKPIYDNILGVINILETPKIKKSQSSIINVLSGGYGYQVNAETKYRLAEPIKYAFNSNSGLILKSEDIRVALFFDGAVGPISDDLIQVTSTVWRTPFMPLGALDDYTIRIKHVYGGSAYGTPTNKTIFNGKITLEFVNTFNFNKPEETMFAARYLTEIVPSSLTSDFPANPYLGIPENLEIRDPVNNAQYVAWNSITITEGANLLPSENINFYSDQVFISTNTPSALQPFMDGTSLNFGLYNPPPNFNPKFYQGINGAYASMQLVPAQTATETKNFCVQKYKPDALIEDEPDLIDRIEGEDIVSNLIVTINPTLFKESFNVMVETGSSGKMSIRLTDLGGNIVHDDTQYIEDKGKWYITVTKPDLPAGFYIALIEFNGEKTIKKVVKY